MPIVKVRPTRIATSDTRAVRPPEQKVADPFYLSAAWRSLIKAIIAKRGRRCEQCGRTHNPDGTPVRIYGDHIKELRDGGRPLDPSNIRLLDQGCHGKKTIAERIKRMANR
jgi:5-methylcytosine-specific restriction enzyme A